MKGDNSAHPQAAADAVLAKLAREGKHAKSVHEAVQLGYLTLLDWCDALEEHRELHRVGHYRKGTDDT